MRELINDFKNWLYIKKTIKKAKGLKDGQFNKFGLRYNWYGRIYTVISLREEDTGEDKTVQNWRAMEKMKPINEYLSDELDLKEIIFPSIERIEKSRSFLVVYSPILNYLTIRNVLKYFIGITLLLSGILYGFLQWVG